MRGEKRLVMIASAPVIRGGAGRLRLDVKFVEGMRLHRALWDGPVDCILWTGSESIPFGAEYASDELGFGLTLLARGEKLGTAHLAGAALVAASADLSETLDLAPLCQATGTRLVYAVEYTLATRLQIAALDDSRGMLRKARSMLWLLGQERRRRKALAAADGVQFNGYPAQAAYAKVTTEGLLYLDGRMRPSMLATPADLQARAERLASGAPLRIVHSGRLIRMKGAQDLVPVAVALARKGVAFTLDVFGAGDLQDDIARDIRAANLQDRVCLHDPVDFETALVPFLRTGSDVFLSCHRQADPSCSYLESLSCGVPVIGYDNQMWRAMQAASGAGWVVPMGRVAALAETLADLAGTPGEVTDRAAKAWAFGLAHGFEAEFGRRMSHLARLANA